MKRPLALENRAHPALGRFDALLARLVAGGTLATTGTPRLRHDVRRNLKSALTMAQWEAAAGVRGVFFLAPTGADGATSSYYGRIVDGRLELAPQMIADTLAIAALGHEIGLLGPFHDASHQVGSSPAAFAQAQVEQLAAHGIIVAHVDDGASRAEPRIDEAALEAAASPPPAAALPGIVFDTDQWSRAAARAPEDIAAAAPRLASPSPAPWPPRFVRADDTRMRVGVVGGDLARRLLVATVPHGPRGVQLQMAGARSSRVLAARWVGQEPDAELATLAVDLDAMTWAERDVFLAQFEIGLPASTELDFLLVDTQGEFDERWRRHRAQGWIAWFDPRFVRDRAAFEQVFEPLPAPDEAELARSIRRLVETTRATNPGLPVVVLHPADAALAGFAQQLERELRASEPASRILVMDVARDERPDPALPASSEPNQKLLRRLWDRGLWRLLVDGTPDAAPALAPPSPPAPSMAEETGAAPRVDISYQPGTPECGPACAASIASTAAGVTQYFLPPGAPDDAHLRYTPTLLPTSEIRDFEAWERSIRVLSGGNRLREKRKAVEAGYTTHLFPWNLFIPDIHEINHSKEVRSGGAMRGTYQRSIEEMGGAPRKPIALTMPTCHHHWGLAFGVFRPDPGRHQGDVRVDEQLVGYISLRRAGGVALYSQILGHGDYLHDGVMVLLHHDVVRWLSDERERYARDLDFIMYGGAESGGLPLLQWKRRAGFRPMRVVAHDAPAAAVAAS